MKTFLNFIKLRWQYILLAVISILMLVSIFVYMSYEAKESDELIVANLTSEEKDGASLIENNELETYSVDVKGAVKKPGVYKVLKESRINDVIDYAGGLTKTAYTDNINLSKRVTDEMVIYIYTKTEYKNKNKPKVINTCICPQKDANIEECIQSNSSVIENANKPSGEIVIEDVNGEKENKVENSQSSSEVIDNYENKLININVANINELTNLPGIGESKAKAIIKYREENSAFKSISDIKYVSGIGDALFEKIKDLITVE